MLSQIIRRKKVFKVSIHDILLYSKCPRKYSYSRNTKLVESSQEYNILSSVIRKAYTDKLVFNKHKTWQSITRDIDRQYTTNISDPVLLLEAYKNAISTRKKLLKWYNKYLHDPVIIYPDLELDISVIDGMFITHKLDYLCTDSLNRVRLMELDTNKTDLDSFSTRIKLTIIFMRLGYILSGIDKIIIGDKVNIDKTSFTRSRKEMLSIIETTWNEIKHISRGVYSGIHYQSRSEQCNTCEYKSVCLT